MVNCKLHICPYFVSCRWTSIRCHGILYFWLGAEMYLEKLWTLPGY